MTDISGIENTSAEGIKRKRLLDNFLDDISALRPFLDDPSVTDIFVVGTGEVIVKQFLKGKTFTGATLTPSRVTAIIKSAAALLGKTIDTALGIPKLEGVMPPPFKARITGILPPWVDAAELTFRKPPEGVFSLENYVEAGRLTQEQYALVCLCIRERKNILVGGGTGSGKTTFTNAVLRKMVDYTPDDRFYVVEDVPELRCGARDKTMLSVNPDQAVTAVQTALRWTPDRIIFGELRNGQVANELLKAWIFKIGFMALIQIIWVSSAFLYKLSHDT